MMTPALLQRCFRATNTGCRGLYASSSSMYMGRRTLFTRGRVLYQQFFKLDAAGVMIPHPRKIAKGGEDAVFCDERFLAVADGVGGWEQVGIDSGKFSRELIENISRLTREIKAGESSNPVNTMTTALQATKATGSSTCCVAFLDSDTVEGAPVTARLRTANLGDSGFVVVRGGKFIHQSEEQLHDFNFPRQLGTGSDDLPKHAEINDIEVKTDDLVILATDGVWDNVFPEEIEKIIESMEKSKVSDLAQTIALLSYKHSTNLSFISPFCVKEFQHFGTAQPGGKSDDISVVVARVVPHDYVKEAISDGQGDTDLENVSGKKF